MLIGSASRYIAGRGAVQRIYWRTSDGQKGAKLVKYGRVLTVSRAADTSANAAGTTPPRRLAGDVLSPNAVHFL